jgi:hypothetical protein
MTKGITDDIIRLELSKKDFELVRVVHKNPDGSIEVTVQKLHPVTVKQKAVYVPLPTNLSLFFDAKKHIKVIKGGELDKNAIDSAQNFVKTLVDNQQLEGFDDVKYKHATHSIVKNEKGLPVVKRNRFSAF